MTDYQRFDVRKSGEITIVDVKAKELSELDYQEQLRDELTDLVATTSPQRLVLSLKSVEFMGSNAIGILVDVRKAVHEYGGQLILCDLQRNVRMSFKVLNLEGTLFKICDTESEALNAFA
ncbi:MAG: STAS domain-containing protein [Planctomycetaceae bacterium]|nr:STAS domain-containing protein [Planctomycetales bacterium]MCB9873463.1 STAS domain-containing protein [Planctomycetaceae bacterium]MCB9940373.1 STAS domain-containing protein [Planctomycetaceae bacterium]HRX79002.1 STAS domain-containing protein [Pirellulaceae bacterium]